MPASAAQESLVGDLWHRVLQVQKKQRLASVSAVARGGELLRVVRDDAGEVVKLNWATSPFRREPFTFGE